MTMVTSRYLINSEIIIPLSMDDGIIIGLVLSEVEGVVGSEARWLGIKEPVALALSGLSW